MYERLLTLYITGRLDEAGLDKAVTEKGWITAEQAEQIRALKAGVTVGVDTTPVMVGNE